MVAEEEVAAAARDLAGRAVEPASEREREQVPGPEVEAVAEAARPFS